ncbi:MAG: M23 family metallopeptidase [Ilumatobacteraceae bacterium]
MTSPVIPPMQATPLKRGIPMMRGPSWWERVSRRLTTGVGALGATGVLAIGLLAPFAAECSPPPPPPGGVVLEAKPVEAPCNYSDTYGAPRSGGRVHLGVDIMAAQGNDLYAVVTGTVSKIYVDYVGSLAGNGLRIRQPDGTYFFYGHLLRLADGIVLGSTVTAGQLVGYVGQTGNAGTPHLHLEIHPQGGAAVNPYPIVHAIGGC